MEQVLLSRIQFAFTAGYHFIFVPITIGIGLIMAIFVTRAYRTLYTEDNALARMWVKIFTATFAIGVATGITMEFSFGTNWANYSRFVGDIFGAPLAAEALFAFFLESIFLGILIFGRGKVSAKFYVVSAWLVFVGSALSALWILIANSWMQTPAGAVLSPDGKEAVITDFFAAAFNPSTMPRYLHTVLSLLVMGSFVTIAVGAWYMLKNKTAFMEAAKKMIRTGAIVGIIATVALLGSAHASAVEVWEEQPTKMAMMEGLYETEVPELAIGGVVDEQAQETNAIAIPGGTSFLATGTWDTEYQGLNQLAETEQFSEINVAEMPVNFVYQVYHIMIVMFGLIALCLILALIFMRKGAKRGVSKMKWLQRLLVIAPIFPFLAIQCGWLTAEVGRQPYVVYPANSSPEGISLLTAQGTSTSVQTFELMITLALFVVVYIILFVGWARVVGRFISQGPVYETAGASHDEDPDISFKDVDFDKADEILKNAAEAVTASSKHAAEASTHTASDAKSGAGVDAQAGVGAADASTDADVASAADVAADASATPSTSSAPKKDKAREKKESPFKDYINDNTPRTPKKVSHNKYSKRQKVDPDIDAKLDELLKAAQNDLSSEDGAPTQGEAANTPLDSSSKGGDAQ